jgi:hypothetical protein
VYGFAGADSLANATSGPLTWSTNSNAASKPGSYAITGSGLSATNYSFSQAAANANALTLVPAIAPEPVRNTATQLASTTASTQASGNPAVLSVSPAITVTETTTVEAPGLATGPTTPPTSKQDKVAAANTSMSIGATGPTLQIVNGGMRLPLAMVNLNE